MIFKKLKSKFFVNMIHFKALCKRYVSLICANKLSLLTLVLQAPVMVIVIKLACSKTFEAWYAPTTMFVISAICVIMATLNSYREVCKERDVLIREINAGLDSTAYILSKFFVQTIICFLQALVIVAGSILIIDFNITDPIVYVRYFLFTFLILVSATCFGLFVSTILKSSESAILPILFVIIAQVVFSGVIIKLEGGMKYISYIVISRWAVGGYSHIFNFKGLVGAETVPTLDGLIYQTPFYVDVLALILMSLVCIILSVISIQKLKKRKA